MTYPAFVWCAEIESIITPPLRISLVRPWSRNEYFVFRAGGGGGGLFVAKGGMYLCCFQ